MIESTLVQCSAVLLGRYLLLLVIVRKIIGTFAIAKVDKTSIVSGISDISDGPTRQSTYAWYLRPFSYLYPTYLW